MSGDLALLRSEWTKFASVRGWVIAVVVAAGATIGLGLLPGMQGSCGTRGPASECVSPVGPEGQQVTDRFTFVRQSLTGDGSLTARVASLTGLLPSAGDAPRGGDEPEVEPAPRAGLASWAKAGLIIKDGTTPGSAYAAVMLTGGHGVRMQHNYVHDQAGRPDSTMEPRWLRLTRTGSSITGAESADGIGWTDVGTVELAGLPSTVEAGLFVTSPQYAEPVAGPIGVSGAFGGPSQATATFDQLGREGRWAGVGFTGVEIGAPATTNPDPSADPSAGPTGPGAGRGVGAGGPRTGSAPTADGYTVTGSGDIAPAVAGAAGGGTTVTQTLVGTFAGLIVVVVIGTTMITAEYRRGLIRTTLVASPGRARVLAAKAVVVGGVAFVAGLIAAAVVVTAGQPMLRHHGVHVYPATLATEVGVVLGTGALLAGAAVLALALGALVRRSAAAVTTAIMVIVLPYLLAVSVLPAGAAQWLLRVAPAAAFALQQSTPQYDQVDNLYIPASGYFPLSPWLGFGVLCGWIALTFGAATLRLRRRDV